MKLRGRGAPLGSALAGVLLGGSFGLPFGWLVAQCALILLLVQWINVGTDSARVLRLAALFSFCAYSVGYLGFAVGVAAPARWSALAPLTVLITAHVVAVAVAAWVACLCPVRPLMRWAAVWPALWLCIEWLFSLGDLAMPWLRLGQLQAPSGPFASALPVGGTLLAGACMWAAAAGIAVSLQRQCRASLPVPVALVGITLFGINVAAGLPLWTERTDTLDVALVQPGLSSEQRQGDVAVRRLMHEYRGAIARTRAAVVVTPQLALPKSAAALPVSYLEDLAHVASERSADVLLGLYLDADSGGLHNGVLALGASGTQRYLKHQLFPFGEFMPLRSWIGRWLDASRGVAVQDTARGPRMADPLHVGGHRAAVAVCFEAAFSDAWRAQAASADFMVIVSSDGSIASDQMSRQSLQVAQTRALEFQKPLLRSSDTQGSYALDHRGHVLAALPPAVPETLEATIAPRMGTTPFARFGDTLPLLLAALALCTAAAQTLRTSRGQPPRLAIAATRLHSQGGQVILPALGLLLVTSGLFYFMVNSGQAVNEKTRVVHAADAAAYSAGIVEARALNYQAYMNRAMVANEIIIAQMVSIASWTRYFANAVDNIGDTAAEQVFYLAPDLRAGRLGAIFGATAYVLYVYTGQTANDYADYVLQYIGIPISIHDGIVQALSAAQQAVQYNLVGGIRQGQIANDIVRATDPGLEAEVVYATWLATGFDRFTKSYARNGETGDERGRFADVTMRSRDEFSRERNFTIEGQNVPFIRRDGALKKRGGTDLVGYDEWRAVDTLELHGRTFGCGTLRNRWCDDIETPVGWAGVNINNGGGDAGAGHHGNAYNENETTAERADDEMEEPGYYMFSGLPDSRDLANVEPDAPLDTRITILVSKRHQNTLTSGGAAQARPAGSLALFNDRPAGARMVGLSRASVFFDRIASRADGKTEIANVYNPYWRVRLVAPTTEDRGWAAARQSSLMLPDLP
jgi:apolipoprotein N-acyltransferase